MKRIAQHKKYIFAFVLVLVFVTKSNFSKAQYVPILGQYMFNGIALNPAYTGSEEAFSIVSSNRIQWLGFDGSPKTMSLIAHAPLKEKNFALGFQVFSDQIGVDQKVGLYPSFAYRIPMEKSKLSLGISSGVNFVKSYVSQLDVIDQTDELLMADSELGILPDLSFGAHYYNETYFLSFSVPLALTHTLEADGYKVENQVNNYNLMLGGGVSIPVGRVKVNPSFLAKYRLTGDMQIDVNFMTELNEKFVAGISYRTNEAIIGLVEFLPTKQLSILFSYGAPLNKINQYSVGSYELGLKYNFLYKGKIVGPRFLGW